MTRVLIEFQKNEGCFTDFQKLTIEKKSFLRKSPKSFFAVVKPMGHFTLWIMMFYQGKPILDTFCPSQSSTTKKEAEKVPVK